MRKPVKIRVTVGNVLLLCIILTSIYITATISTSKRVKSEYANMSREYEQQYTQQMTEMNDNIGKLTTKVEVLEENNRKANESLAESDHRFSTLWNSLDAESKKKFETIQKQQTSTMSRGGDVRRTYDLTATAYAKTLEDCGKTDGITYSGRLVKDGWTVAVDPKVIPLGSILYIEFPEPFSYMNGYYRAQDIGGAIKGYKLDVFISDVKKMKEFGVVHVKATIIEVSTTKY